MARTVRPFSIGSVSSGTMRPEDLIPDFLWELESLDKRAAKAIRWDFRKELKNLDPECELDEPEEVDSQWLMEALFDALNDCAPPYVSFGAHEGDGADYGFWPNLESLEEDCRNGEVIGVSDTSEVPSYAECRKRGTFLVWDVNDHGNGKLYRVMSRKDRWGSNLRELWSIV